MSLDIKLDHLEQMWEVPSDDKCQAYSHPLHGEQCSVTARWACHAGPQCSGGMDATRVLWCDVRHARYLRWVALGGRCICGQPATHWTVVPL